MKPATILLRIGTPLLVVTLCVQRPALSVKAATDVRVKHVYLVVLENHSYSSIIGNKSMPWLNGLASRYAYATAYYANTHPSIGNYFGLTTGKIITNNDGYSNTVNGDNIVRHLLSAGKTWKEYTEGLPRSGYTGGDTGEYTEHHSPLSYFSDVRNSSNESSTSSLSRNSLRTLRMAVCPTTPSSFPTMTIMATTVQTPFPPARTVSVSRKSTPG
jgi:Phosphoesterase family